MSADRIIELSLKLGEDNPEYKTGYSLVKEYVESLVHSGLLPAFSVADQTREMVDLPTRKLLVPSDEDLREILGGGDLSLFPAIPYAKCFFSLVGYKLPDTYPLGSLRDKEDANFPDVSRFYGKLPKTISARFTFARNALRRTNNNVHTVGEMRGTSISLLRSNSFGPASYALLRASLGYYEVNNQNSIPTK